MRDRTPPVPRAVALRPEANWFDGDVHGYGSVMKHLLLASALTIATVAACGADDAIDEAADDVASQIDDATDATVASRLADQLEQRTALDRAESECAAGVFVEELGGTTVVRLLLETNGNLDQLDGDDRAQVEAAARTAADACGVTVDDITTA